jgi:hypothetical protein
MFVVGALTTLLGVLFAGVMAAVPIEQIMNQPTMPKLPPEVTPEMVKTVIIGLGIFLAIVGLVFALLGVFVRRGSKGAIITSIVLTFLAIAYTACNGIQGLPMIAQGGAIAAMGVACSTLLPGALFVWLVVWLFQAKGAANRASAWSQYGGQNQYYQQNYPPPQQQQQQGYPPSQQPQNWQQPGWPPPPPAPPSQQQQNWPPPQNPG